jgi:peptidoglycan-N-acetylglucosamine deacetylase
LSGFVFHDPSGRRARRAGLSGGVFLSLLLALFAAFAATLAFAPKLPDLTLQDPRILKALHDTNAHAVMKHARWAAPVHPRLAGPASPSGPLAVGFYVSWDERSRESLRAHVEQLDVVAPQWVQLSTTPGEVTVTNDPQARAIIQASKRRPAVMPLVYNAREDMWDGPLGDRVIADPAARARLIARLGELAEKRGYAGYMFDFESLSERGLAAYPQFLRQARAALAPLHLQIWVTAPFADRSWPLKAMQAASDSVVLMAYDQHWATGGVGPAAAQDWFQDNLARDFAILDPGRTIVAAGAYGYDWTLGPAGQRSADALTFHEAALIAHDSEVEVDLDPASLNPHFAYADEKGRPHEVWFLDAVTLYNQLAALEPWRAKGYGLWRMGSEDPGVWSLLDKPYGGLSTAGLEKLGPGEDVDFDGTGEVLRVSATPTPGKRSFSLNAASRLIETEHYDVLPTSYVLKRYGAHPGLVALTFDDGPDPRWTPKILDVLKAKHAQATFFVIGQNMQTWPGLVRREVREGNVVGGHTWTHPNIGETGPAETALELNATQRLFETITGKSQRLFRPPYFGDAEPSTPSEVAPLLAAQKLGYMIVGLRVDPDDWKKPDPGHIVSQTLARLADPNPETVGQVVLLHDSGGDRSRTVQALPTLIDALRAHGYRLVTVAQLAGMTADQAMPSAARDPVSLFLDRLGFGFARGIQMALHALFVTAIALGVGRLVFLASLALIHRSREPARTPPFAPRGATPLISVLIPCFNEEKVIASSIHRILGSDWPRLEVIVLDDGSKDRTADEVRAHFARDPRVRLMSFPNGGKARALNRGLAEASGEIVVALDADTQFERRTIAKLARWFEDPEVGAVAGDALVGNRVNLITRWQALEYVVAQNLERRALSALGAVTVVPGAVGAWRRQTLVELGGYPDDTLAEDQDLTLAVQRAGWRVEFDPDARAWTEAPDTVGGLLRQRFRWSFGTLQCLWKHRSALFSRAHPVLGFFALPQIWLFQIVLACAAPLVDLAVVWSLVAGVIAQQAHPLEWDAETLILPLLYWAIFVLVDLSACALGMAMERRAPWRDLFWVPLQRFGYRQLMYYVVAKAVITAVRGPLVGWGALERRATVALDAA